MNAATDTKEVNPYLKMALELVPVIIFFFANARGEQLADNFPFLAQFGAPIFIATALFIPATVISLVISLILTRTIPIMPLITGVFVVISGGLTLYLQDETFIKMKPTVVNMFFGSVLMIGLMFGKSLLKYAFDTAFKVDDEGWRKLTFRWACYFFFLAIVNEIVWRNFSTDFWVAFKVWGTFPMTLIFMGFQWKVWQDHILEEPEDGAPTDGAQ